MLRPYSITYSKIHELQSFVNYIMLEVIFRAPKITEPTFSSDLVIPKYKALIDDVKSEYVLNPLSKAYLICKGLCHKQIKLLKTAVHNNNKIKELCEGNLQPVRYTQIEAINKELAESIKTFCDYAYNKCINLAPYYNKFGKVDEYYKELVGNSSVCRCCGINKILTLHHTHRSALDHYLARKHYPFNSINFYNLIPICDTCNSKYKLSIDALYDKEAEVTTVAFFPYSRIEHNIDIKVALSKRLDAAIMPTDIDIAFDCPTKEDEVKSWDRMFGIKENYKAECCSQEMLSYYEEQYIALKNHGINRGIKTKRI